ncbi:MAG TPA: SDR family NAD(P)-dependent oxidoreductase [Solirubrobacteraceae bacterium]|jgi:short-subunit dehydrogenase|nr:SDR family NAD(P)-dependent oxidoreductase [Solirubrobacteraceae bacterium]
MAPAGKQLRRLVTAPANAASKLANRPIAIAADPFALVDRVRGGSLEDAVKDRVVLITGGSSGIGAAAARQIGAAGGIIVLVARTLAKLEEEKAAVEAVGGRADVIPCDLTDMEAIDEMADEAIRRHGQVDVLVNNAGRSIRRSIALSYDRFHDFERTMQLNYFAAIRLILRLLPTMRERRSGHIINISSVGVQTRVPRFAGYIASKAALDTWSDAVQAEVHGDNIRFTTVHMPLVRTPMISPTKLYDRFPTLTPEEAADTIARAIIHRPRRLGSPFGHLASVADAITPQLMDAVRYRGYSMFPDSRAARGDTTPAPPGADETVGPVGQAFARATRGVHW